MTLDATLSCPACGVSTYARMPTNQCVWFFPCPHCNILLKPKPGDCCVFCSYADRPCPSKQTGDCCPPS